MYFLGFQLNKLLQPLRKKKQGEASKDEDDDWSGGGEAGEDEDKDWSRGGKTAEK